MAALLHELGEGHAELYAATGGIPANGPLQNFMAALPARLRQAMGRSGISGFAAPGLMAGNVGLLKHSSNVPQTALFLEDLFRRAGFPEGAFQTLLIGSAKVERVLRDPRVKAATLTGSEPAGRSVAAIAGDEVKPTVLELGGSDPFVVMPSADLAAAAEAAATSRCLNNGQSCISAKRFMPRASARSRSGQMFAIPMVSVSPAAFSTLYWARVTPQTTRSRPSARSF